MALFSFTSSKKKETAAEGYLSVHLGEQGFAVAYRKNNHQSTSVPDIDLCHYFSYQSSHEFVVKLSDFVKENHLQHVLTNFVLKSSDYRLVYLDAPQVSDSELPVASRYLVKDFISFPLNEAVVDAFKVPTRAGQKQKMYVVVAEVTRIEAYVKMLEHANLTVDCMDIPELALANFLTVLEQQVEVKRDEQPAPSLTQPLTKPLSEPLIKPLSEQTDAIKPPETKPPEMKETPTTTPVARVKETALLLLQPNYAEIAVSREHLLSLAREVETPLTYTSEDNEVLEGLSTEIERSISYYQSHLSSGKMEDFWVLSMLTQEDTLIASLKNALNANVKLLDVNEKVNFKNKLDRAMQARCLVALGGVLRESGGGYDTTN